MRPCLWYHTADKNPDKSGYYMGFRTVTLADDTCGVDYFYWNHTGGLNGQGEWRTDHSCHSHWANVYYWTVEDPEVWVDEDPPVRSRKTANKNSLQPDSAMGKAWADVMAAVERYELIKALSK